MKTLIKILCLSAFLFAEDIYPYFSEPVKQLEFEERKVNIIEIEEKEMIISGGSQFNFWYLIDQNQPAIVPGNIKTDYIYKYKFEIKHNNKLLSEIQLLELIGLNDRANEIRNTYKKQMDDYNNAISDNQPYIINLKKFDRQKHRIIDYPKANIFLLKYMNKLLIGYSLYSSLYNLDSYNSNEISNDAKEFYKNNMLKSIGLTSLGFFINKKINNKILTVENILNIRKPILIQTLTDQQLKSISESYNRKIYNEILEK